MVLCASRVDAFYAGFEAVREHQRGHGRTTWLQLSWLLLVSGLMYVTGKDEETLECVVMFRTRRVLLDEFAHWVVRWLRWLWNVRPSLAAGLWSGANIFAVREQGGVIVVDPSGMNMAL